MRPRVWIAPVIGATVAVLCYVPFLYLKFFDFESILYLAALVMITLSLGFVVLIRGLFRKRWISMFTILTVVTFLVSSFLMANYQLALRPWARWLAMSGNYKSRVLSPSAATYHGLRYIDWDGWGWAGSDTNVYLVYDPEDKLKSVPAGREGEKYRGVTDSASSIKRLENHWYSITCYTDQTLPLD